MPNVHVWKMSDELQQSRGTPVRAEMAKRVVFSSVGAVGPGASNLVGSAPSHATLGI